MALLFSFFKKYPDGIFYKTREKNILYNRKITIFQKENKMCCNPVHTISNVVKMAKVFKKLDEINFAIDPEKDSELIGTVVDLVKVSNLSADEIVNEVLEMHTLEMAAL